MLKNCFTFLITLFVVAFCHAQVPQPAIKLPTIVPASPAAGDLAKYVNYPVSYANGLPDISIPIFVVTDGDINIPIGLSYHASGYKIHQPDGWLSRGWTLNAEPIISRSIQGKADEKAYISNDAHSPLVADDSRRYMEQLEDGIYDEQPDEFYFKLPDMSGKFFIKKVFNQPLETITVPKEPVKIKVVNETNLNQFTILDNKGLSYDFGGPLYSNTESTNLGNITSWKSTSVTSTLTGRSVSFTYHPVLYRPINPAVSNSISILDTDVYNGIAIFAVNPLSSEPPPLFQLPQPTVLERIGGMTKYYKVSADPGMPGQLVSLGYTTYETDAGDTEMSNLDIHEIIFSNGKVVFNKTGEGNFRILKSIEIYNNDNLIKEFEFHQKNLTSTIYRLDSISIKDANRVVIERYKFKYNEYSLSMLSYYGIDYWGYSNGANNTSLIPSISTSGRTNNVVNGYNVNFVIGGANREPDEYAAQANILKSITYPTGGKVEFEYEGNRYRDPGGVVKLAGGLRIRSIKQVNTDGTAISRFFKYGVNEDGVGILRAPINEESYFSKRRELYCKVPHIGVFPDQIPAYQWVTTNLPIPLIRRTYSSHSFMDLFYENGSPVQYPVVTEYTANDYMGNGALGKQMYYYNVFSGALKSKVSGETTIIDTKIEWYHGEDTLSRTFKSQGTAFIPIQKQQKKHTINYLNALNFSVGKTYTRTKVIADESNMPSYRGEENIGLYRYSVSSGYKRPWIVTDENMDDGLTVSKEVEYLYDDYLNLTTERFKASNNDSVSYEYQYPYSAGSMLSFYTFNNNISPVILKRKLINNVLVEQTKTNYRTSALPGPLLEKSLPVSMDHAVGTGPLEKRIDFSKYDDRGNILSVSKVNDVKVNYIYGYNGNYPIAKVENAEYATIETVLGGATAINNFRNIISPTSAAINTFLAPLRTHVSLKDAMVTTYTYSPLIGMTSETDPSGKTISYSYDAFGRLKTMKDSQGKILKQYDYQYQAPLGQ